jgi:predicted nicotinamide N-methyase
LQLGAGTSLPGIVAAKCGADAVLSDDCHSPQCLENTRRSADMNGLQTVEVLGIRWGKFDPDLLELEPVDIILGSDCFYDTKGRKIEFSTFFGTLHHPCNIPVQKKIYSNSIIFSSWTQNMANISWLHVYVL